MLHDTHNEEVNMTSKKLKALQKELAETPNTVDNALLRFEIGCFINHEQIHIDDCEFIKENKRLRLVNKRLRAELAQYKTKTNGG